MVWYHIAGKVKHDSVAVDTFIASQNYEDPQMDERTRDFGFKVVQSTSTSAVSKPLTFVSPDAKLFVQL